MNRLRYLAIGCECDFIILDHVSMVVSGLDVDERKTIDILMTELRRFCEQTGVGILAVSHLKRNSAKGSFNEGAEISLNDLRGSAGLEQLSDVVIALERDQQADLEEKSNRIQFRVLKNRPFGTTGIAGHAMYDRNSGRLTPWSDKFKEEDDYGDIPF
jgi:twinkle protein